MNKFNRIFLSAVILLNLASCDSRDKKVAPLFDNIGNYHHSIKTNSPLAQCYFDQGLILFYSFEYGESIRAFRAAIKADPDCAMCYWGLALSLGSKTAAPLAGDEMVEAKSAIKSAMDHVNRNNLAERLYMAALSRRYIHITPIKLEFSAHPMLSLPSAKRLNTLVPVSEHMAHMPCHTYYSLGQYHAATLANQQAIAIYKNYVHVKNKALSQSLSIFIFII